MNNKIFSKFDVAIVGAGPAGCTASILLAKNGVNVCLIDSTIKSSYFGYRELLSEQISIKLQDILGDTYLKNIEGINIRRSVKKWNSNLIGVKNHNSLPLPISIDRSKLRSSLQTIAIKSGVTFFDSTKVFRISYEDGISKIYTRSNDFNKTYESDIVIIASGRMENRLSTFVSHYKPREIAFCFEAKPSFDNDFCDFLVEGPMSDGSWWYSLPSTGKCVYYCFCIPLQRTSNQSFNKYQLLRQYDETQLIKNLYGPIEIDRLLRTRWAGSYSRSKILGKNWVAIGDAAYSQHPLSGRGIDFSIFSAIAVSNAITSKNSNKALSDYSKWVRIHSHAQSKNELSYYFPQYL